MKPQILIRAAVALVALAFTLQSAHAASGGLAKPTISCGGQTANTITLTICAGAGGAQAGFSVQYMKCADFVNGTAYNAPGQWPTDPAAAQAACLLFKISMSGNANGTEWSLGAGQCHDITIGATSTDDPGVTYQGCPELGTLSCGECYVFRSFAHNVPSGDKKSGWSDTVTCSTEACPQPSGVELCTLSKGGFHNNPGGVAYVTAAYPGGITIGGINIISFGSSSAIINSLPGGGSPSTTVGSGALTASATILSTGLTSGGKKLGNLASQVLALRLNLGYDPDLGGVTLCGLAAGNLATGGQSYTAAQATALNGQTVAQFEAAAETYLGGGANAYGLSNGQWIELTELLNTSYDAALDGNGGCLPSNFAKAYICGDVFVP